MHVLTARDRDRRAEGKKTGIICLPGLWADQQAYGGPTADFFQVRTGNGASSGHESVRGLSQIDLFARARIIAANYRILFDQAQLKLPDPSGVDREPLFQNASRGAEGRLLLGRSGRLARKFLNLEFFHSSRLAAGSGKAAPRTNGRRRPRSGAAPAELSDGRAEF